MFSNSNIFWELVIKLSLPRSSVQASYAYIMTSMMTGVNARLASRWSSVIVPRSMAGKSSSVRMWVRIWWPKVYRPVMLVCRWTALSRAAIWNSFRSFFDFVANETRMAGMRRWKARSHPVAKLREMGSKSSELKSRGPEAPAKTPFRRTVAL